VYLLCDELVGDINPFFLGVHNDRIQDSVWLVVQGVNPPTPACTFFCLIVFLPIFVKLKIPKNIREALHYFAVIGLNIFADSLKGLS